MWLVHYETWDSVKANQSGRRSGLLWKIVEVERVESQSEEPQLDGGAALVESESFPSLQPSIHQFLVTIALDKPLKPSLKYASSECIHYAWAYKPPWEGALYWL